MSSSVQKQVCRWIVTLHKLCHGANLKFMLLKFVDLGLKTSTK